jgi:hypothetical protein
VWTHRFCWRGVLPGRYAMVSGSVVIVIGIVAVVFVVVVVQSSPSNSKL